MNNDDLRKLRQMIEEIKEYAASITTEGAQNSLLSNIKSYEYALDNGLLDFDYVNNFFNPYVDNKIPLSLIPAIFDHVKKYTGINITPYKRDERLNRNCNILKSCMIYHQFFEHFQNFIFVKDDRVVVPKNQDVPNEKLNIPNAIKDYILQNWEHGINPQAIIDSLRQLKLRIYGVIMFQFYNLIFVLPIKRIGTKNKNICKIIDTRPIPIPNIPTPPQFNIPPPPPPLPPQVPQRPRPQPQTNPIPPQLRISNLMNQRPPPSQIPQPQVLQGDFDEEENLIQWF